MKPLITGTPIRPDPVFGKIWRMSLQDLKSYGFIVGKAVEGTLASSASDNTLNHAIEAESMVNVLALVLYDTVQPLVITFSLALISVASSAPLYRLGVILIDTYVGGPEMSEGYVAMYIVSLEFSSMVFHA